MGRRGKKSLEKEKVAKLKSWLKETAAENRKNPTWAEQNVINYLEKNFIDYRFQKPVVCGDSGYIIDFYFKGGFALEVDGESHNSEIAMENDKIRTKRLNSKGYSVIRIKNEETKDDVIDETMKRVLDRMNKELECDFDDDEDISCFSKPKVEVSRDANITIPFRDLENMSSLSMNDISMLVIAMREYIESDKEFAKADIFDNWQASLIVWSNLKYDIDKSLEKYHKEEDSSKKISALLEKNRAAYQHTNKQAGLAPLNPELE